MDEKLLEKLIYARDIFNEVIEEMEKQRSPKPPRKRQNLKEGRKMNFDRYYKKPKITEKK